ncbi:6845_t:CDS:2, partial [Funneliformis geosporum]
MSLKLRRSSMESFPQKGLDQLRLVRVMTDCQPKITGFLILHEKDSSLAEFYFPTYTRNISRDERSNDGITAYQKIQRD